MVYLTGQGYGFVGDSEHVPEKNASQFKQGATIGE
jgi:hypothetical protein